MDQSTIRKALELCEVIISNAYAPYSGIRIASVVITKRGSMYPGVNVENSSYGLTMCAERIAVFNAITHGDRDVEIVVVATTEQSPIPPCGACRQVIAEFNPNARIVMYSITSKVIESCSLQELLPRPFLMKRY